MIRLTLAALLLAGTARAEPQPLNLDPCPGGHLVPTREPNVLTCSTGMSPGQTLPYLGTPSYPAQFPEGELHHITTILKAICQRQYVGKVPHAPECPQ